jgi:hypothetical protein
VPYLLPAGLGVVVGGCGVVVGGGGGGVVVGGGGGGVVVVGGGGGGGVVVSGMVTVVKPCGPLVVVTFALWVVVGAVVLFGAVVWLVLPCGGVGLPAGVCEVPTVWPVYGFTWTRPVFGD